MELRARNRSIAFPRRPLVMGIVNINDDSFSGDGRLDIHWALARAAELVSLGADIVDAGAESARTNRRAISEEEEIRRLVPFITGFGEAVKDAAPRDSEQVFPPLLSVNTWRPAVAKAALESGGDILDDMGGLPGPENARLCAASGAALVIMHTMGEPKFPRADARYDDVIAGMQGFFAGKIELASAAGIPREQILLDPGIDFAKQQDDNLTVYRHLSALRRFGRPLLLPVSRKTVIGQVLGLPDPVDRDAGTVACIVAGMMRGASIFRVHNVDACLHAVRTVSSLMRPC